MITKVLLVCTTLVYFSVAHAQVLRLPQKKIWERGGFFKQEESIYIYRREAINSPSNTGSTSTTCFVVNSGKAMCWGNNEYGQLGTGDINHALFPQFVPGMTSVQKIEVGSNHVCSLASNGGVKCWGQNNEGQLGIGTTVDSLVPLDVERLNSVTQISLGSISSCAIHSDATVSCWGSNDFGQLGDSTAIDKILPVKNNGLSNVSKIDVGGKHACAVINSGEVRCWGSNEYGQLGDATTVNRLSPVPVSGISNAVDISVGESHTCALLSDFTVRCWGRNNFGQLGNGNTTNSNIPVATASSITPVTAIGVGEGHSCAQASAGVYCWGRNSEGQLGNASTLNSVIPVLVSGSQTAEEIFIGGNTNCLRKNSSDLYCWGNNSFGQVGDGTISSRTQPLKVLSMTGPFADFSKSAYSIMEGESIFLDASTSEGSSGSTISSYTWNFGEAQTSSGSSVTKSFSKAGVYYAKLNITDSNGKTQSTIKNIIVRSQAPMSSNGNSCSIDRAGRAYCWGNNSYSQLLNGNTSSVSQALLLDTSKIDRIVMIESGEGHFCALRENGSIKCWGDNTVGQIGDNTNVARPFPTTALSGYARRLSVGAATNCFIYFDENAYCWGYNNAGQLGDTSSVYRLAPTVSVPVIGNTVRDISVGDFHTCAVLNNNTGYCWGLNDHGQIGNNSASSTIYAPTLLSLSNLKQISSSVGYNCATQNTGAAYCWGDNSNGTIGDGTTTNRSTPKLITAFNNASLVSSGDSSSCALLTTGALSCWGYGFSGAIGDGTFTSMRTSPTAVSTAQIAKSFSTGRDGACLKNASDEAYCWGANTYGQIGDSTFIKKNVPTKSNNVNQPFANIVASKSSGQAPLSISFSASASLPSQPTATINSYAWNFGDGQNATGSTVSHTFSTAGPFTVALTVTDSQGKTSSVSKLITSISGISIELSVSTETPSVGDNVAFIGAATDPGYPVSAIHYSWSLGDGTTAVGSTVGHSFQQPGDYLVSLTAENEFGFSDTTSKLITVGLSSVISITRGENFTCALHSSGELRCFGSNSSGELGQDSTINIGGTPTQTPNHIPFINLGGKAIQISSGQNHSCAVMINGNLKCWGDNDSGQLGYGNTNSVGGKLNYQDYCYYSSRYGRICYQTYAATPMANVGYVLPNVSKVAVGVNHTCVILSDQALKCWGNGSFGKLGNNSQTKLISALSAPIIQVGGPVVDLALGNHHTCVLLSNGKVRCFGNFKFLGINASTNVGSGEAGGTSMEALVDLDLGGTAVKIKAGQAHTCALLQNGKIRCWGMNPDGRLGYGNTNDVGYAGVASIASVGDVQLGDTAIDLSLGKTNTCALLSNHKIKCWGSGVNGRNGNGSTENIGDNELPLNLPYIDLGQDVTRLSDSSVMAQGFCAILNDGSFKCWGTGTFGQNGYANTDNIGDDEPVSSAGNIVISTLPPYASLTASHFEGNAPATFTFDASASMSGSFGGSITEYLWNFGSGQINGTAVMNHTFNKGGSYEVSVKVTDNKGLSATKSITVTVLENELIAISQGTKVSFIGRNSSPLSATVFNQDGSLSVNPVTWISSNENVATINNEGKITAYLPGTITIKAKVGTKESVPTVLTVKNVSDQFQFEITEDDFVTSPIEYLPGFINKSLNTISSEYSPSAVRTDEGSTRKGAFNLPIELPPGLNTFEVKGKGANNVSTNIFTTIRYFDGVKDSLMFNSGKFAQVSFKNGIGYPASDFTIALWLRATNRMNTQIFNLPYQGNKSWKLILNEQGSPIFKASTATTQYSVADFPIFENDWVHIAITYDKQLNELSMYRNGRLKSKRTLLEPILVPESTAQINLGGNFYGLIDDFKMWNSALTSAEIKQRMFEQVIPDVNLKFAFSFDKSRSQLIYSDYNKNIVMQRGDSPGIDDNDPEFRFASAVIASKALDSSKNDSINVSEATLSGFGISSVRKIGLRVPKDSFPSSTTLKMVAYDSKTPGHEGFRGATPVLKFLPAYLANTNNAMEFLVQPSTEDDLSLVEKSRGLGATWYPSVKDSDAYRFHIYSTKSSYYFISSDILSEPTITYLDEDVTKYPIQTHTNFFSASRTASGSAPYSTVFNIDMGQMSISNLSCNGKWIPAMKSPVQLTGLKLGTNTCLIYYSKPYNEYDYSVWPGLAHVLYVEIK